MAEVLITLGIIGVIASFTLPALTAKIETSILKNRFKKVYSVYSQALIKTIMTDYDGNVDCFYPEDRGNAQGHYTECVEFFDKFASNMKLLKKCDNDALANGCIPDYDDFAIPSCSLFNGSYMSENAAAYVLNDGSSFVLYQGAGITNPLILIDTNGKQKPNYPGKDVFTLSVHNYRGAYSFIMDQDTFGCFSKYAEDGYRNLVDINN